MADTIDRRRRFVFRGNAAAVGGRFVYPKDVIIDSRVSCSLTVAGGRTHATGDDLSFGSVVVGRADVSAEGLFDDVARHLALTNREVTADALTTTTKVHAKVEHVRVGVGPTLEVNRLRGELRARSPLGSGEPSIPVPDGIEVDGVEIGGYVLEVVPAPGVFQRHDTRAKLLRAADDPDNEPEVSRHLLMRSELQGVPVPAKGRLLQSSGTIYGTVVKPLRWANGREYPHSVIKDHTVYVPGFGKLVFGEILITDFSRRLTMLRLELGSPEKGDVAFAEVETNGVWT